MCFQPTLARCLWSCPPNIHFPESSDIFRNILIIQGMLSSCYVLALRTLQFYSSQNHIKIVSYLSLDCSLFHNEDIDTAPTVVEVKNLPILDASSIDYNTLMHIPSTRS